MSSSIQPRDLDAEESPSVSHRALVAMNMDILEPPPTTVAERLLLVFGKPSTELCHSTTTILFSSLETGTPNPQRLQRIVHSWGHGLTVMQFSGSQITRLSTVHGRRHSSIDHFTLQQTTPTTDTDIHQLTCQFLESANAVADNLSLRLSPPATRSNRRLLSGTTKRAILASNIARQAFIAAATNRNPDPVQCNTLRDEWSRLKAAATQLREWMVANNGSSTLTISDRAVSDGRTDLVFAAARAMSGNSSRSAAVTPLYNSRWHSTVRPNIDPCVSCNVTMDH
ncbi:hypothetical protein BASA83_010238 [Batrachochytrium salamandrivorans]|nr:hypothetical protein BASA83_010238 [Batrachochytrium salamandrivorans]